MEQVIEFSKGANVKVRPGQPDAWGSSTQPYRKVEASLSDSMTSVSAHGIQLSLGKIHARRISHRNYQRAQDRLKRANRDLGETAAFMLALVTTTTAIEAVINIADGKIHLRPEYLQMTFDIYMALFITILLLGGLRCWNAIHRRSRAEKEIDQTKKWIFDHCPEDQWPKAEE